MFIKYKVYIVFILEYSPLKSTRSQNCGYDSLFMKKMYVYKFTLIQMNRIIPVPPFSSPCSWPADHLTKLNAYSHFNKGINI